MEDQIKVHRNLPWNVLKAMNDLYCKGRTTAKIHGDSYIRYLLEDAMVLEYKFGSRHILLSSENFEVFFEKKYREKFSYYLTFLTSTGLESDARRNYTEEDIQTLMFIDKNRIQISGRLTTQKSFSNEFFEGKGSKYLEHKSSLKQAVCHLLGISDFPDQDAKNNQWRFVVDCPAPSRIILCENLDFLKMFWLAEKTNAKLWYVGGNNIKIIEQIDRGEFKCPFYYSGDWDYAGLSIYSRIKDKLAKVGKEIKLLYPNNTMARLPVNSPHHYSFWNHRKNFSGLDRAHFSASELSLIEELIRRDEWIEEESNDLELMIGQALLRS